MADNAIVAIDSARPRAIDSSPLGEPVDFDVRGLGRRLPRTDAPEGWIRKIASSAESVGRFRFGEPPQVVIKGNFHGFVGAKAIGSSGHHSDFVVETLNSAIGDFSFGPKPIQDQWFMGA